MKFRTGFMDAPKWRLRPTGISQMPLPVSRCVRSRLATTSLGIGSDVFRNSVASIAFDQVYDACNVKPFAMRRSMRVCKEWYQEYPAGSPVRDTLENSL